MRAVWARAKNEMRAHRRAVISLILLAGLPGGVAVAAAVGASRTDSVADRLIAATKPPDIYYVPTFQETKLAFDDVSHLPAVAESFLVRGYSLLPPTPQALEASAPRDVDLSASRVKVLAGRFPRPDRIDEAVITFVAANRYHWHVGTRVTLALAALGSDPTSDSPPSPGPVVQVRVVGIVATMGDFASVAGPGMQLTPAFERAYRDRAAAIDLFILSLHGGSRGLHAFEEQIRGLAGGQGVLYVEAASDNVQIKRTFHLQALALWVMCAFMGAVSLLIIGQSVARQSTLEAADFPALRALGMTRENLAALGLVRSAVVALAAGALALLVGVALSPFTPVGTSRIAEPHPGIWAPAMILVLSGCVILLAILVLAAIPSWRAAAGAQRADAGGARPSWIARLLSAITTKPAPTIGARFALEPGRGVTAVPVRSSLTAGIVAIIALMTALTVNASVRHLATTPELYGQNWDANLEDDVGNVSFSPGSKDLIDLTSDPSISDAAVGIYQGATYRLKGVAMDGVAFDAAKGDLGPVILEGRSPKGPDEVVVGRKSLEETGTRIGSTVDVGIVGVTKTVPMRVVGLTVLPFDDDVSTIGQGLWMTRAGLLSIVPGLPSGSALIRFIPGVSRAAAIAKLKARFPGVSTLTVPNGVLDYRRLSRLPLVLAGLLAALAAGTLAHMLVSSIRRRRRDLAILKTLGFARRQLRNAVNWQAGVFTMVAFAIAAPFSIVVARWTWNQIARYGGFASATVLPVGQFAIVAAGALAVGLIIAVGPARAAAQTPPAVVLRAE